MARPLTIAEQVADLSRRLHSLDEDVRTVAADDTWSFVASLPIGLTHADDAVSLHAMALGLAQALFQIIPPSQATNDLTLMLLAVLRSAASYAETMAGVSVEERPFIEATEQPQVLN